ncbi:MAG: ATP-dependent DNA helicase RecG [Parcubacteria group bacterium]
MVNLDTELDSLPRITPKYAKALKKLRLFTVSDLLRHFPFRYDDYSAISPISEISPGQTVTICGEIIKSKTTRTWKRKMTITEVEIRDGSGKIKAVWFNQPYLSEQLVLGKNIRMSGKISVDKKNAPYFSNPVWEMAVREATNTGRLVPVYPETEGLSSRWLRWQIQNFLKISLSSLNDPLPPLILKKLNLPPIEKALRYIHFPSTLDHALIAQKRFAFEEMFLLQLKSLQVRNVWQKEQAVKINFDEKLIQSFVSKLPFKLTNAQRKATFEILKDLEKSRPLNRLLNGDVGSGKTVVAAIASLQAISAGYQAAIMAPTEVLAHQHFLTFSELFKDREINIALLTNSYKIEAKPRLRSRGFASIKRENLLHNIKSGEINLIIGTHALIQEDIRFKNLALIIVDEQHRFGVTQRAYLQQNIEKMNDGLPGKIPHFLTMTATPIPRTLALAFFGNLDISLLDEMPKDRKKIITQIVDPQERNKTYEFVRQEVKNGRQVFVILPLVEESKVLTEVRAAVAEHKRLSENIFPDLKVGLIHGRLKSAEKEKVMQEFSAKKLDILVATAVVEVGIDISNATVMIIEDADRFGLSQLHQFRGRIGRSEHQSYCFLFAGSDSANAKKRLRALVQYSDGFKIAEVDLKQRGPGEFLGTRQSGLPDIAMENIANIKLVQIAREEAENILKTDAQLKKHPLLKDALKKFQEKIHLE